MFNSFSSRKSGVRAAVEAVSDVTDDALKAVSDASKAVSHATQRAVEAVDANRNVAASGLASAAGVGHTAADRLDRTADRLDRTAEYIRRRPVKRMFSDLAAFVTDNPGPSLAVAAVAGFLVGRAISRSS
jgi:ElaB/YqjD/DUF883 family membrane-anchored ribosome-binding protein